MPRYTIVTTGTPSALLRAAFPDFDLESVEGGRLRMLGTVRDGAELLGVLHTVQDLGQRIVDVHLLEGD